MSAPAISSGLFEPPQFPTRQVLYGIAALLTIAVGPFLIWPTLADRMLAANFLPHLYCYLGKPGLVWTHVVADSLIGLSYVMISGTLVYLVHKGRHDIPFHWMFLAFGSFIVACGGTHFMEVVTVWVPVYVLSAGVKIFTALVSVTTAVLLPFTVPQILSLIQTAKASEAAEGRFRALLEAAPDAMVVADKAGRMVLVNTQTERLFGYRRDELLGREIEMLVPERLRGQHPGNLTEPRVPSMETDLATYGLRKEGREFPIEISRSPLATEEGVLVSSAIRDITERKRAEQELRESEDRYRDLVEALPDAIFVVSEERIVFVNPSGVRLLGARRSEEIVGKELSEIIHPNSLASIRRRIRDSYRTGVGAPPMEHVLLALDGSSVDIESASIPITWKGLPAMEAIARDIRKRKRAEERLREYEKAVEGVEEMIVVVDREYRYVLANRAFLNYRGLEKEQVVGHSAQEMLNPGVFESVVKEKLEECFEGKVVTYEMKYTYPRFGERDIAVSYFPIEGPNGVERVASVMQDITERKRAEEALQTSEREQHKIAEQLETERARLIEAQAVAKVGSWETELPSLDITWSDQTHRIFETDPSYFHPRRPDFVELVHPEDRAKVDAAFEASLEKGAPSTVEYRIVMADGRVKVLEEHWKVFHNGQGRPARLIGTCQDITERKRAETAVLRFAAIVESSDDAIISKDLNGVITSWNAGARRTFGFTEAEAVGQPITIIIPPELLDEESRILQRLRAGEHIEHYETSRVTKQGKRVDVSLTISPMKDSEGRVVGASKIARDITERKQTEEALQRSEAEANARADELAVILDAVPGMALITRDPSGQKITGSRVAYELLRLPYGANISKSAPEGEQPSTFRVVRDGQELAPSELPVQKAAATGQEVRESEVTLLFDDGTSRDIFGNAAPLLDREGKVRGAIGVFVDITEHKRAEQALQESQAALARVARIVTMGELTASIAHEINQPLAAVATNASASLHWLAVQPPNLVEAREAMANAMKEANRASGVIARIRTLLKKASPELRPVDMNEVIREVLALVRSELIRGGVTAKMKLATGLPAVLGDRVQLQQVVLNLIMNAIDAMITISDRPRTLLIKSAKEAEGVLVQVQDSGKGLDPQHSDRMFESFFTTKPEGIGIGLSISSSIVEAHGGSLSAKPGASYGATFEFTLPRADYPRRTATHD
jgi:PAS domain S-box-containing protein